MIKRVNKILAYVVSAVTVIIGVGSLLVFAIFLWRGGFETIDLGRGWQFALVWDGALCLTFFLQHSGMIRRPFRNWLGRFVPPWYHGAVYTIASGIVLLVLCLWWQPSRVNIMVLEGAVRWSLQWLLLLALSGVVWGIFTLGNFDAFGTEAILSHVHGAQRRSAPLTITGPYRWVRHPF